MEQRYNRPFARLSPGGRQPAMPRGRWLAPSVAKSCANTRQRRQIAKRAEQGRLICAGHRVRLDPEAAAGRGGGRIDRTSGKATRKAGEHLRSLSSARDSAGSGALCSLSEVSVRCCSVATFAPPGRRWRGSRKWARRRALQGKETEEARRIRIPRRRADHEPVQRLPPQ